MNEDKQRACIFIRPMPCRLSERRRGGERLEAASLASPASRRGKWTRHPAPGRLNGRADDSSCQLPGRSQGIDRLLRPRQEIATLCYILDNACHVGARRSGGDRDAMRRRGGAGNEPDPRPRPVYMEAHGFKARFGDFWRRCASIGTMRVSFI